MLAGFIAGCSTLGRSQAHLISIVNEQGHVIPNTEVYAQFKKQRFMRIAETEEAKPLKVSSNGSIKVPSRILIDKKAWGTWLIQLHVSAPGYAPQTETVAIYENSSTTTNPHWEYPYFGKRIVLEKSP